MKPAAFPPRALLVACSRPLLLALTMVPMLAALPAAAQPRELPDGALRVQRAVVVDQRGFERPMPAAAMMLPAGWRHQGEVQWNPGARCGRPYQVVLQAQAPDGIGAIVLAPGEAWGASSMTGAVEGCAQGQTSGVEAYLRAWVQRHRPGAQWLDYRARPERSREELNHRFPTGGGMRSWVESGQVLVAGTHNGQPVRETLATSVRFIYSEMPMLGGVPARTLRAEALGVLSWRAPAGRLDLRQFDAVWDTLRSEPEWQARIDQANAQMSAENQATQQRIAQIQADTNRETMAHIVKRGQIRQQTQAEIAQMRNEGWRNQQASQDRMHTERVKTIRGVEHWRNPADPSAGRVELPNTYSHAWKLRDGSYVLTDSPSFDPGRDLGLQGDRLEMTR